MNIIVAALTAACIWTPTARAADVHARKSLRSRTLVDDPPSSVVLDPGCDEATQNRIELTCGQLTSKSSDACKDAYSKCLPAIAEAIVEGLPYAGCTKGTCGIVKTILGSRELEWSANGAPAEKFCCPKKQDEPSGCESHEPVFPGWPHCCVKNEGKDKCSSFSYNGHPKLEYTHSVSAGGHPVQEIYCCPDDPAIGARLQREADAKEAAAAELKRLAEQAEKKAKEKAAKELADQIARDAKLAAKRAAQAKRAAEKAERERLRKEAKAKREEEQAKARLKAQEAREAAEAKREEEKAKRLQAEMEAAEAAEAAAKATQAAKEAATAREEQDDAKYIARGCLDNSVYRLIFGPRKPASERKPCPENLPSAEVGIECMGKTEADVIPGKHWCCKHSDWRKQCIADCKGQGHTEPGNECFVKCRVDVLYTKVPGAMGEDPDPPPAN